MNKSREKNILLLFGGIGAEHEVSVMSADALFSELSGLGYKIIPAYIDKRGEWYTSQKTAATPMQIYLSFKRESSKAVESQGEASSNDLPKTQKISLRRGGIFMGGAFRKIYCAIPALHGDFGEDGYVQGALLTVGIPFVGCDVGCGATCADKSVCKLVADSLGIKTAESLTIIANEKNAKARILDKLTFPIFIKPTSLGSSLGAACADNEEELDRALTAAFSLSRCVLVERFIKGARELECAFFEHKSKQHFTMIGEIRHSGRFYGYDEKYSSKATELLVPRDLSEDVECRIQSAARLLASRLGLRHLSRLDFFLSESGEVYFNEINTMPGLTAASMFPFLLRCEGFSLGEIFSGFIESV